MTKTVHRVDWERIEPAWRAGVKSVLQIAAEYEDDTGKSISHTAINKHFKKLGVPRDLKGKIQSKADSLVSAATVSAKVSTETTLTDALIINEVAQDVANIRLSHRKDISRTKALSLALLDELSAQTIDADLYAQLGDMLRSEDDKGMDKLNDLYKKVVSTPSRIDSVKKLADTLKTLVGLEREAWGISSDNGEGNVGLTVTISDSDLRI